MPLAERIYLTQVMAAPAGDAYFPAIDFEQWRQSGEIEVAAHPADTARFRVRVYHRRKRADGEPPLIGSIAHLYKSALKTGMKGIPNALGQ